MRYKQKGVEFLIMDFSAKEPEKSNIVLYWSNR